MPILNVTKTKAAILAAVQAEHTGTVSKKTIVGCDAIAAVEAAARIEIGKIARAAFGPGKTIHAMN